MAGYEAFGNEFGAKGVLRGGERLRPTTDATTVQVRDGKVAHVRRPVRRDQGADRRLLRRRLQRPRRGDRASPPRSRGPLRHDRGAADLADVAARGRRPRSAREWGASWRRSSGVTATGTWPRSAPRTPSRAPLRPGDATACPTTPAPGSPPPRDTARSTASRRAGVEAAKYEEVVVRGRRRTRPGDRDRRRPAAADLHLLPPGAGHRRPGRAHAAHAGRAHHGRDRARVPGHRRDDGQAPGAGQGQDPPRRHPLPGAARPPARPSARPPCSPSLPRCSTRATRPATAPTSCARDLCARRHPTSRGSSSSSCPTSPRRSGCSRSCCCTTRAARLASTTPATSSPSRTRTAVAGTAPQIDEGLARARRRAAAPAPRPVPGPGGHRRVPRARTQRRGHRLVRDRPALRPPARARAARQSSSSTERSPSRWPTGPSQGLALVDELDASGALAGYPWWTRRAPTSCAGSAATARPPTPTSGPEVSPEPTPSAGSCAGAATPPAPWRDSRPRPAARARRDGLRGRRPRRSARTRSPPARRGRRRGRRGARERRRGRRRAG